jgi:hypothetical protein
MNLRILDPADMLLLTRSALGRHAALLARPEYGPVKRAFEQLLPDLIGLEPTGAEAAAAATANAVEGRRLDLAHDRLLRGLLTLLDGVQTLADDATAAACADLTSRVFPGGYGMTQRTYTQEAAEGPRALARVTDADRALLAAVALPGGRTAHDVFEAWIAACDALETFEKGRLSGGDAAAVRFVDVRNRFIRAVRGLETQADLCGDADDALLAEIRAAVARAEAREPHAAEAAPAAPPADA